MKHILPTLILLLAALGVAAIARVQHRRGVYAPLAAWWRGASRPMRGLAPVFVLTAVAYGSDKILGGRIGGGMRMLGGAVASLCTNVFTSAERQTGYAVSEARTNETHDLAMPAGAQMAERIARRGAHDDGFWLFDFWTNRLARAGLDLEHPVWVQTDGTVTVRSPAAGIPIEELSLYTTYSNIAVYAPRQGSYGFLPGSRWPDYNVSRIWTAVTDRGNRVITWEGALRDRNPSTPVSFQAEFHGNGDISYRYDPPQTDFTGIGLYRGGMAQSFGLSDFLALPDFQDLSSANSVSTFQPFNLSTLTLSYVGDLGDGTGDTDNDGLTDWEEVKRHHTDPREADTDGDGLLDGYEVQNGTDPLDPDSNGDGILDGWTAGDWAAHRLFNAQPGDRVVAIRLAAPTPPGNHAVLRIGDLPVLLCETNTWTFSIPTGTVWNVELRTGGLPVVLALEAGAGVFVEDGEHVFASCATSEAQGGPPMRSAPPPSQPPGGTCGGRARIHTPCIFLEPVIQHVHGGGSATVTARCIPEAAPLAGRLDWTFDPPYLASCVEVADDRLSATVSGQGTGWFGSVTLHADVGAAPPAGLSTSAIVCFCDGHEGAMNAVSFPPPHTNATVTPVFRTCPHPFGDDGGDPRVFLEAEVGRETASGWQHLAWLDADPDTPGVQRRAAISRDNPPTFRWNAKADTAQPLSDGTDAHFYDANTTFARALPAVAAGQYAPPPLVTIVTRTFDGKGNLLKGLTNSLAIPQYVQVSWTTNAVLEFQQPIVYQYSGSDRLPTNVTIFAGCTAEVAASVFSSIPGRVQGMFPAKANIVVVGPDAAVPQPHKTVTIYAGRYRGPYAEERKGALGLTPEESIHERNDSPTGTAYVFNGAIRGYIRGWYQYFYTEGPTENNDWRNVQLPLSTANFLPEVIAQVALHECGHTMGLVPSTSAISGGHNDCDCGSHYMDEGGKKKPLMRLGLIDYYDRGWMRKNELYLQFAFPETP